MDPLAERHNNYSPYAYVLNNPILRIDPNGLTDYKFNRESGELAQVGDLNDEKDRILKTYSSGKRKGEVKYKKNGNAKVEIGDIEKGILSDGMNFKSDDNIIQVGGEGQPALEDVEDFLVKISDHVDKEIAGVYLSGENQKKPSAVYVDEYEGNTSERAGITINTSYIGDAKTKTSFHTHLSRFSPTAKYGPSTQDKTFKAGQSIHFTNFLILSDYPQGPIKY